MKSVRNILERPSPNFDSRGDCGAVDTIVLHATVLPTMEEVVAHFANPETKVSAHYTIDRDGTIVRHVAEHFRAWHAGTSRMPDGREGVNYFSIGIELVNLNSGTDLYCQSQIDSLAALIRDIKRRHPIHFIVSHAEIATPPGRKNDPVGLDLERVKRLVG